MVLYKPTQTHDTYTHFQVSSHTHQHRAARRRLRSEQTHTQAYEATKSTYVYTSIGERTSFAKIGCGKASRETYVTKKVMRWLCNVWVKGKVENTETMSKNNEAGNALESGWDSQRAPVRSAEQKPRASSKTGGMRVSTADRICRLIHTNTISNLTHKIKNKTKTDKNNIKSLNKELD